MAFTRTNQSRLRTYEVDFLVGEGELEYIKVSYPGTWQETLEQILKCNLDERFTIDTFAAVREVTENQEETVAKAS